MPPSEINTSQSTVAAVVRAIRKAGGKHFLQSPEWTELRKATNWKPIYIVKPEATCFRRSSSLGGVLYVPGYIAYTAGAITNFTDAIKAQPGRNVVCKLEPCVPYDEKLLQSYIAHGWKLARHIQYTHTVVFDLTQPTSALWDMMKRRARNEINKAMNSTVKTREADATEENFEVMYNLLDSTSRRKSFTIREKDFVLNFWRAFAKNDQLRLFFSEDGNDILAGAVVISDKLKKYAWYKDGASVANKSASGGPRLLFWEIAQKLQKDGYDIFDLGGIPEPETYQQSHMKGIYIFKTAYSRDITQMMPALELPLSRRYKLWSKVELGYLKVAHMRTKMWY